MPTITPDFTQSDELQPGIYEAKIIACELKTAKESGNQYLGWKFATVQGNHWVYLNTTMSKRGAEMFRQIVQTKFPDYQSGPFNTDTMIGHVCKISLIKEDGQRWMTVTEVSPANDEPGWEG